MVIRKLLQLIHILHFVTKQVVSNNYTRISSFQVLELEQRSISYEGHDEVSAERNFLKDQQSVGEKEVNGFENQIRSKDEEIRRLEHELALKDEEMRHLKSQLDLKEKEFARLRIAIQSACTDLGNAVTTVEDAFKSTNTVLRRKVLKIYLQKKISQELSYRVKGEQNNQRFLVKVD